MSIAGQIVNFVNVSALKRSFTAALAAAAFAISPAAPAAGANFARVVVAPDSGAALFGYDPVSYFVLGEARIGRPDLEVALGNQVWRFASEANRQAFLADREGFLPGFGGHDPALLARGYASAGDPEVFLIHGGILYFFRTAAARLEFASDAGMLKSAIAAWPGAAGALTD